MLTALPTLMVQETKDSITRPTPRGAHGWTALVTNKHGNPVRQKNGQYHGFYVSTTSLQQKSITDVASNRYVDARTVPYIALPKDFAERFGIVLGDLAVVVNEANGQSAYAIFADIGPRGRIGEGSIALAGNSACPPILGTTRFLARSPT